MAPLSGGPRAGSWCQLSPGSCGWLACGRGDIPAGGCRLSPPCGGTPPAPPFPKAAPPPLCIAGAAAANFLPRPLPHLGRIWAGAGRGGVAGGVGGSGGPGAAGGRAGAPGRRDEGGRCLGDGAGAGTAAKGCGSCAGWRWLGGAGGTRGFRVPPLPRAGPCSGELPGDPSRCCWWGLLGSRPPDLGTGVSSTLGVASDGGLESDVTRCTHPGGQGTLGPGPPQGGTGWAQQ